MGAMAVQTEKRTSGRYAETSSIDKDCFDYD